MYAFKTNFRLPCYIAASLIVTCAVNGAALTAGEIDYEPHNRATATVSVLVSSVNGQLEYSYSVHNVSSSARAITSFKLQIDLPVSSLTVAGPATWGSFECCIHDKNRMNSTNIAVGGWLYGEESSLIQPGSTLPGFKVAAKSVPGIKRFFIESYSATVVPDAAPANQAEADELAELTDYFNDSTTGLVVGPEPPPGVSDAMSLIARLIDFKHQSASLRWIAGPGADGIIKSLDVKLDAAKAALSRGQNKTAINQLKAFVKELDAQRSKHLNDSAYYLLKVNAEFIIGKLEP